MRQRIGVVPQRPNPDRSLNVIENLLFHAAYFGISAAAALPRANALLEQLGIADKAHAKVDEMSGGQQQRLMIARALIHEPQVIFLDEPTVGLDPQTRLSLWEILRALHNEGRTIVMTTHYMEEADKLCDRIAIVDRGELLELDTPEALKRARRAARSSRSRCRATRAASSTRCATSTACCAPRRRDHCFACTAIAAAA